MAFEIAGVPVSDLQEPIYDALIHYSDYTGQRVTFGLPEDATELIATPEKPYSAQSSTPTFFGDEFIGNLIVVAFAPGDGTGSYHDFKPSDVKNPHFPHEPGYFPRRKDGIHTEAHLPIVAQDVEHGVAPILLSGNLSIIGIAKGTLTEIGYVGQPPTSLGSDLDRGGRAVHRVTLTTGYKGVLRDRYKPGERFADPHALVNRGKFSPVVQVAGFLAVTQNHLAKGLDALHFLNAQEPVLHRVR